MTDKWPRSNGEMVLGWTLKFPRPTEENGHRPEVLESRQRQWDEGEALRTKYAARSDQLKAERETKEQEARDQRRSDRGRATWQWRKECTREQAEDGRCPRRATHAG